MEKEKYTSTMMKMKSLKDISKMIRNMDKVSYKEKVNIYPLTMNMVEKKEIIRKNLVLNMKKKVVIIMMNLMEESKSKKESL